MDYSDLFVLGSGPAGAPLAHPLAPPGKSILLLDCDDNPGRNGWKRRCKAAFAACCRPANEAWRGRNGSTIHRLLRYDVESDPDAHRADPFRIGQGDLEEAIHNRSLAGGTVFLTFGLRGAAVPAFLPHTFAPRQLCQSAAP